MSLEYGHTKVLIYNYNNFLGRILPQCMGVWLLLCFVQYLMPNSLSPGFVTNHLTSNIHSHIAIISLTRLTFLTGTFPGPSLLKKCF